MRNILIILVTIALPCIASGQELTFGFHAGYGTFGMKSLKEYQTIMKDNVELPDIEEVESFPGYIYYSGSLGVQLNSRHSVGINGVYLTTGARNSVADYSGEYRFDILLNGYRLGLEYEYVIINKRKLEFYGKARAGAMFSSARLGSYFDLIMIEPQQSNIDLQSTTFFGEPSLGLRYNLIKDLSASFDIGFQADTDGKLHKKDDKESFLQKSYNRFVYINWTGLRVSLGLTCNLNLQKHE